MNRIWANQLEQKIKTWNEVPSSRKVAVDVVLKEDVQRGAITVEFYNEIINGKKDAEQGE